MGGNRGEVAERRARTRTTARRREGRWAGLSLIAAVVLVGVTIINGGEPDSMRPLPSPSVTFQPMSAPSASAKPDPVPNAREAVLPAAGSGTFRYEGVPGQILGSGGPITRFRLAVESDLDADLAEFGRMTDATLGDRRSWVSGKRQRFQRVPDEASSDFTIALVTRETAFRLCARGGLDIRVDDIPFTSCQVSGWVVINLDRWRLSTPDYVSSGTPLQTYRQYVINHEVGHQLGYGHEQCPGNGQLAPTMQQQTLGLEGCKANPWPYPNAVT